jgi:ElaB/YqjD/DUF883 family membrane-anchored ribosome-binding protein
LLTEERSRLSAKAEQAQTDNQQLAAKLAGSTDDLKKLRAELADMAVRADRLQVENQRLEKWKVVDDADAKAEQLIREAQAYLEKADADASVVLGEAQRKATALTAEASEVASKAGADARNEAKSLTEKAKSLLDGATVRAKAIVDDAEKRAKEIAGSAYDAMNKATLYEQTAKAMRNMIDGYGDQYIVPSRSLLDGLADEFGHTEAGQQLKVSRERSAAMVLNRTAATCDYVEPYRRQTAIEFVVDAFNGKVDSVLSRGR